MKDTFLYFAYGSNLLTERIRINNPTAVKKAVAKLQGYKLDFNVFVDAWHGAVATINPTNGSYVWGVVWELKNSDLRSLDRQEMGYDPVSIKVTASDGQWFTCRTYRLNRPLEDDRKPSLVYKNVIVKGAMENELPKMYVDQLHTIEDNGYNGPVEIKLSFRG